MPGESSVSYDDLVARARSGGPMDASPAVIQQLRRYSSDPQVPPADRGRLLLALVVAVQGDLDADQIAKQVEEALQLLRGSGGEDEIGSALGMAAAARAVGGDLEVALEHCLELAGLVRSSPEVGLTPRARVNFGVALLALGAYQLAEDLLTDAIPDSLDEGLPPITVAACLNLTLTISRHQLVRPDRLGVDGETVARTELVDHAMATIHDATDGVEMRNFTVACRAHTRIIRGQLDEAVETWGDLDATTAHSSPLFRRWFCMIEAHLALHRHDLERALLLADRALEEMDAPDFVPLRRVESLRLRSRVHEGLGNFEAALVDERRAADLALETASGLPDMLMNQVDLRAELERRQRRLLDEASALSEQAHLDEVSGLLNRRAFEAFLESTRLRPNAAVHVLLVDLDNFKDVNDRHGHAVGDQVITAAGGLLQRVCRGSDRIFRYGGDEFVIVPDVHSLDHAVRLASRITRAFETGSFTDDVLQLTCSVGVASGAGGDVDAVVAEADRELYTAKDAGRNRVSPSLV